MKTKDNIGAYEKLLNVLGLELDDPYWKREKVLRNVADKLQILDNENWLDSFLDMNDVWITLENSCWYESQMESHYDAGYYSGSESAWEDINIEIGERFTEWKDKLLAFLKDKWMNLNKEQVREVEDFIEAYPIPE